MIKKFLIILSLFIYFSLIYSQDSDLDSLFIKLKLAEESEYSEIYNQISLAFQSNDPKNSKVYAQKALNYAEPHSINYTTALINLGIANEFIGNKRQASNYYLSALKIAKTHGHDKLLGRIYLNLGYLNNSEKNYPKAITYFKKSIVLFKKMNNLERVDQAKNQLISSYNFNHEPQKAISILQDDLSRYKKEKDDRKYFETLKTLIKLYRNFSINDKALEYTLESFKLSKKLETDDILYAYNSLGNIYNTLNYTEEALKHYNEGLDFAQETQTFYYLSTFTHNIGNIHSENNKPYKAIEAYLKSLELIDLYDEVEHAKIIPLVNIASIYLEKKKINKAEKYLNKADSTTVKHGNEKDFALVNYNFGDLYFEKKEYKTAKSYLEKALLVYEKHGEILKLLEIKSTLSKIAQANKNYKYSNKLLFEISDLENKLYSKEKNKAIAEANIKYNILKKEKEIESLKTTSKLEKKELQKTKLVQKILLAIFLVSFIILVIFAYIIKKITTLNKQLTTEKEKVEKSLEDLNEANESILALERKNIVLAMAITANHEIRQPLMILNGNLELLFTKLSDKKKEEINKYIIEINKAKDEIAAILDKYKDAEDVSYETYAEEEDMIDFDS